jgi:hypothetical protein
VTSATVKPFAPLDVSLACDPFAFLEKLFVHFLQSFFTHDEFLGTGMHWLGNFGDDGDEVSEMVLTAEKPNLETVEKVPHIVCVLGSAQWSVLGLDQMQKTSMKTGERTHTDLIPMTVAYHCQAKSGMLARRMAWYSAWATVAFRRLIMKQGKIHQVSPQLSIGPETGPTAYTGQLASEEVVSVVVTVPFYWQPQWRIREPAPTLAAVKFDLGVLPARVIGLRKEVPPLQQLENKTPEEPVLTQSVVVSEED